MNEQRIITNCHKRIKIYKEIILRVDSLYYVQIRYLVTKR